MPSCRPRTYALLAIGLAQLFAACTSGAASDADIELSIANLSEHDAIDSIVAGSLHYFVQLDATLDNASDASVSSSYALFTVTTDQGFVIDGDTLSCALDPDCSPDDLLAPGDQVTRSLVFHVPTALHAVSLGYGDGLGHTGNAAIRDGVDEPVARHVQTSFAER